MMANSKRVDYKISSRVYETIRAEMARLGRDEDTKAKIAKTLTGTTRPPFSDLHKQRMSDSNKGKSRFRSPEHAQKLALVNTGKKRTPEQCARMGIGIREGKAKAKAIREAANRTYELDILSNDDIRNSL